MHPHPHPRAHRRAHRHLRVGLAVAAATAAGTLAGPPADATAVPTISPQAVAPTGAGSIVFTRNDELWVAAPDGSHQTRLSNSRKFAQPSQADDGTVVAISDDGQFYRFTHGGQRIGEPVSTWLGINGGQGFSGPFRAHISPNGSKIAYSYNHVSDPWSGQQEVVTAYTYADRYTPPRELGQIRGWTDPSWIDDTHSVEFSPSYNPYVPAITQLVVHELGHADPNAENDHANAYTWYTDTGAPNLKWGEATRAGDKLAAGYDGFGPARTIRLYSLGAHPAGPVPGPATFRCELANAPGDGFENVTWSPDGQDLAYAAGGNVYVVHVGSLAGGCAQLGSPRLILQGAEAPDWGPADVSTTTPPGGGTPGGGTPGGGTPGGGTPAGGAATSAFVALAPHRILDTRPGAGIGYSGAKPAPGSTIVLPVAGQGGVPSTGATAVVLNVTATDATDAGFVTVWGDGNQPDSSNLNVERAGQTRPNLVTTPLGADGSVRIFTSGETQLIADVVGYYFPTGPTSAGRLQPLTPTRILDTRTGSGIGSHGDMPAAGSVVTVPVSGAGGVPVHGAAAVVLNVTATEASGPGFVTVFPEGTLPLASNLNLDRPGQTIPNQVIVPVGADGSVRIYTSVGTHLIADVVGWFTDATAAPSSSGLFVPVAPRRLLDTRGGNALPADGSRSLPVGIPDAHAVVLNVTATNADAPGYVTIWGDGARPNASNLNVDTPRQTIPNHATTPVGAGGVQFYSYGAADLLADLTGYYT